jgi:hypothetical protein
MQNKVMKKDAAITVRLPLELKRKLAARARQERRSLSAQVEHELAHALGGPDEAASPAPPVRTVAASKLLGRYEAAAVPSDGDIAQVRSMLWGTLGRRGR